MEKKNKIIVSVIIAIILIIALFVISFNILTSEREFKVTILNQSGREIFVLVHVKNNSADYFKIEVTTNGLENGETHSLIFKPTCKDFSVFIRTEIFQEGDFEKIANATYYFQGEEFYDLHVTIKDQGETIIIEKQ